MHLAFARAARVRTALTVVGALAAPASEGASLDGGRLGQSGRAAAVETEAGGRRHARGAPGLAFEKHVPAVAEQRVPTAANGGDCCVAKWTVGLAFEKGVLLRPSASPGAHGLRAWKPERFPRPAAHPAGREGRPIGEGEAFLSSLVLPGLAQYRLGSRRWIAYAVAEGVSAVAYGVRRREAADARGAYRDLAWDAARRNVVGGGARRDGGFEYYEAMAHWDASGAWDADPRRGGVQPETDPATHNGSIWVLAAALHDVSGDAPEQSPGFERALDYYRRHAHGPAFLWDWRGTGERARFAGLIRRSDSLFGQARRALWIVLANHLASALDGFVSTRLAALPDRSLGIVVSAPVR